MNPTPRSARVRRTLAAWCAAGAVVSAAALVVNLVSIAGGAPTPRAAADGTLAGQLEIRDAAGNLLTAGGSATTFRLLVPAGATAPTCPGDTVAGWQISSYMVPAAVSPAGLTFSNTGPVPLRFGADLRLPLFAPGPFVNRNLPSSPLGQYIDDPQFTFAARTPGQIPPGTYNIGLACINGPAGPNQMDKYWNTQITFVASDTDPAGVTWCAGASCTPGSATTTTTGATTTTTGATTTTTTTGATTTTTIGGGGGATTTSTTVTAGGATTSTVAGGTTTTVPGTRSVTTPGGAVTLSAAGGTLTAFGTATVATPPPAGITMPFGQFTFSATTTAGSVVTFTMTLPSPATAYYKFLNNVWANFTFDGETGAQVSGNTVTIRIKDNGRGDSNTASGQITDPGAPTVSQTNVTTTTVVSGGGVGGGGVSNPGGSLVATGSSPWGAVVWAVLLLVFGRMAMLFAKPVRVLPPR